MGALYGLIGRKLGHSFSKKFFTEKFANEGIDAQYLNFELETIDELHNVLAQHPDIKGFNVTIPYKVEIIPLLHWLSPRAQAIGAVNCIKIVDGKMYGYNTDAFGFKHTLLHVLEQRQSKKALVLGSGGAAQSVKYSLLELGIEYITVSRQSSDTAISYDQLTKQIIEEHQLIINTTPLGMFPDVNTAPEIPYQLITPKHTIYDLVYNPSQTRFMMLCKERGASTVNGSMMLLTQALGAWAVWNTDELVDLDKLSETLLFLSQP